MIHTKRVIFMILPLLFVPLVYGLSSTPDACAAPQDPKYGTTADCKGPDPKYGYVTCCWEVDKQKYCQACKTDGKTVQCGPVQGPIGLEQPPTPQPFNPAAPLQGGVLEQLQNDQPPLFGRNEGAVPLTGGIERPFTSTTPPLFGNIPQGGGFGILQEPETPPTFGQVAPLVQKPTTETPPTPLPTPPPPDFTPQDNQGGGLPTIENQENVPPGGGVAEQPEDDGQEDSSEGSETAGPLT
jgi:hypothetical protein